MARVEPSDLELQVLSVLWSSGPSTVHAIHENMPDGKTRAYTTVLTILQNLERKRLVRHRREGNANVYSAVAGRDKILGPLVKRLLRHVFRGRPAQVVEYLLSDPAVDAAELDAIRQLLSDHERRQKGGADK